MTKYSILFLYDMHDQGLSSLARMRVNESHVINIRLLISLSPQIQPLLSSLDLPFPFHNHGQGKQLLHIQNNSVFLAYSYYVIGKELWGGGDNMLGLQENSTRQPAIARAVEKKRKIVKMSLIVVVLFGICWLPYHVYFTAIFFFPGELKPCTQLINTFDYFNINLDDFPLSSNLNSHKSFDNQ